MKVCKRCGAENKDDAKLCEVCGEELDVDPNSFEWVLLLTSENQFEAEIVGGLLEQNGINVMLKRPGSGFSISSPFSNPLLGGLGKFNVFVMRTDLEKALELIKSENIKTEEEQNGTGENDNE